MGGLILGSLAVIIALWLLIASEPGDTGVLGVVLVLAIFAAVTIATSVIGTGPEYASSVVKIEKVIPVAGYYISDSGDYATESGEFGFISTGNIEGGIPEASLTTPPIILTIETKHKENFWHLKERILTKKVLRFDGQE